MILKEKWLYFTVINIFIITSVLAYSRSLYTIINDTDDIIGKECDSVGMIPYLRSKMNENEWSNPLSITAATDQEVLTFQTIITTTRKEKDPIIRYQQIRHKVLFGDMLNNTNNVLQDDEHKILKLAANENMDYVDDVLGHYPSGSVMRAELFQGKRAVHLLPPELMHRGHCYLKLTKDYMQTAVNAFSIFLGGGVTDVLQMPSSYVLRSVRFDEFALKRFRQDVNAELFQGKRAVHLLPPELMHRGHCYLKLTKDYMQTAVNAFSIFLGGGVTDVLQMPSSYVLRSARTIAMMKIEKEKLAATWIVVKGDKTTEQISHEVLEMYRPLFKYLNGREIARLNLSDDRILNYIGTHADLDRHQVGVIASKYIKINPRWMKPRYLNQMNNLLCGVPMTLMRRVPSSTYLQLNHQVFYHIRACDPLQRRFYLTMMTRTQALGKSYSWRAKDVSRLGLLLSEIDGAELAEINPEAMSGITAQVMLEIPTHTLTHITDMQIRYMSQKPLNILAKKLRIYEDEISESNANYPVFQCDMHILLMVLVSVLNSLFNK